MRAALPWAALVVTVIIWAGYLVIVRHGVGHKLSPNDMGLLRSAPAALLFLPFTLRHGLFPAGASWADIAAIGGMGGTVFVFFLASGMGFAPVADSGVFAPSMLPFFVAILGFMIFGATYSRLQISGLILILVGALAIGGATAIAASDDGRWIGHLLFLAASASWAIYTLRFRASGLPAVAGAAVLVTWSALAFLALAPFLGTALHTLPRDVLILQVVSGIAAGVVANFTFLTAVEKLGAAIPAASAALVPVIAAIGAWVFLGEDIAASQAAGIAVAATGVALASGLFNRS